VCKHSAQLSSPCFFPPPRAPFTPSPSHKLCATRGPSPAYPVTVLFYRPVLFTTLLLDSIVVSKHKCKNDSESKKSCKFINLYDETNIRGKLRGGMCAVAVGLTLRWSFILTSNFPFIFYFNAFFQCHHIILHCLFTNKNHSNTFMIFCLFILTFHGRVPVSLLTPHNIKFVHRGFTESVASVERLPCGGRGFII
jgi:hypothetical protein